MMAVWSPGFYRVEDYAKRVQGLSARTTDEITGSLQRLFERQLLTEVMDP
jgi:hypothetical protein